MGVTVYMCFSTYVVRIDDVIRVTSITLSMQNMGMRDRLSDLLKSIKMFRQLWSLNKN